MAVFATLIGVLLSIASSTPQQLPAGTELHVRLTSPVGSYASKRGSPVSAVLIEPVTMDGETVLPAGCTLRGRVKSVTRVGLGLRHETASLDLEFDRITLPEDQPVSIAAQVTAVDNGRERVARDGNIEGIRSTGTLSYRVSGYIRTALDWEMHAELAEWVFRSILFEMPEPEIYYPAGVELTLVLTEPVVVTQQDSEAAADPQPTNQQKVELARIAALMPYRTRTPISDLSADLTNLMFIGSQDQIVNAFQAAGWSEPRPASLRDGIHWIRAVAELHGDDAGSMSVQLLKGAEPDMAWEKGLNDVSKRHHIRIWKAAGTWHGQDMWIGAATHDIDISYLHRGKAVSHRIDEEVDQERDKVAYDIAFSNCGSILDWTDRPDFPQFTYNATGDPIVTDGRMAVIQLNDCSSPRLSTANADAPPLPQHGNRFQRILRREILSARNELLRDNLYWRTFEGTRWLIGSIRRHEHHNGTEPEVWNDAPQSTLSKLVHASVFRMQ